MLEEAVEQFGWALLEHGDAVGLEQRGMDDGLLDEAVNLISVTTFDIPVVYRRDPGCPVTWPSAIG